MILDQFIAGFKVRFPEYPLSVRESDSVVVIDGTNPAVGNIEVQDDLDELIVFIGDITHGHFDCHDDSLSQNQKNEQIARAVLDFLADVFANKVEFYRAPHGGGGWRPASSGSGQSHIWFSTSSVGWVEG